MAGPSSVLEPWQRTVANDQCWIIGVVADPRSDGSFDHITSTLGGVT